MVQQILVGLIVLGAFAWAAWYWMPAHWRRALAHALVQAGRRLGMCEAGAARMAGMVAEAPGCSSCESCGGCATPGDPAVAAQPDEARRTVPILPVR